MAEARTLPVDRLLGGYLLVSGTALLFPHRGPGWSALLFVHIVLGAGLLWGGMGRLRAYTGGGAGEKAESGEKAETGERGGAARRALGHVVAWYPLLLMPFLYWELPNLIGAVHDAGTFFDGVVMAWEDRLFGHQPAASLAARWDDRLLSEVLHFVYLSYYPVIYFFPAALYLRGRDGAFQDTLFALMAGFVVSYLAFIVFPVQGPRYLFPAPGGAASEAVLYGVTHSVLESGSSQGAAFPSAHAAIAVVQTVNAARHLRAAVPLLALAALGICLGAVYGGFHYAVDMLAGAALGLAVGLVAPRVREVLR